MVHPRLCGFVRLRLGVWVFPGCVAIRCGGGDLGSSGSAPVAAEACALILPLLKPREVVMRLFGLGFARP